MAGVPVRRGGTWNQQGVDGIEGGGQVSEEQTRRGRKRDREGSGQLPSGLEQLSSWSFSDVRSGVPRVIQRGVKPSPA